MRIKRILFLRFLLLKQINENLRCCPTEYTSRSVTNYSVAHTERPKPLSLDVCATKVSNCLAQTTHSAKNDVMNCNWQEVTKELQFYLFYRSGSCRSEYESDNFS